MMRTSPVAARPKAACECHFPRILIGCVVGLLLSGCAAAPRSTPRAHPAVRTEEAPARPVITQADEIPALTTDNQPEGLPARTPREIIELGRSHGGKPVNLYIFGTGADAVLVIGGIHGDEPTSAAVAQKLVERLETEPEYWDQRTVAVLPCANPDGLAAKSRDNRRSVDLNRNFPARNWRASHLAGGQRAASEPETEAVLAAIERIRPRRILAIHACRSKRECNNYDGPAEGLAEAMAMLNGYPLRASMGYPTPGSLGSWAGSDRRIPTVTLELPRDLDEGRCWEHNAAAVLAFVRGVGMTEPVAQGEMLLHEGTAAPKDVGQ
jgi:murein peptide amidase A